MAHPASRLSFRRTLRKTLVGSTVLGGAALMSLGTRPAAAQVAPTPFQMVSQMDFECRPAAGPPPVQQLGVRQLNPVLQPKIPFQQVVLGPLEELCVPVSKNGQTPGPAVLPLIQWTDVGCYPVEAPPINVDVSLRHLNPQLTALPDEHVTLTKLAQVCVPMRKNNSQIPDGARLWASYFDLGCYDFEQPTSLANTTLVLSHLNPVIRAMGFDDRRVEMKRAGRLCVPIGKNNQVIPPGVLQILQWADFLRYRVELVAGVVPPFQLWLQHMNPLFAGAPLFPTVVQPGPFHLLVPVAKDNQAPPGGPGGAL